MDPELRHLFHSAFFPQNMQLAERLKFSDPLLLERPDQEQDLEPDWLVQLRAQRQQWEVRMVASRWVFPSCFLSTAVLWNG